ncbi:MAG: hypothetical protein KKA55_04330 [Proteobacteria bacterium]|nr:hypothetical protein [Pseudomonadota bacterium]MBU1594742.1 hypothetical protein [Pseudomonadota bacterium]
MPLYFPHLHPELLPDELRQALPEDLRFLDPGLALPDSSSHFLPDSAPFDRSTAKAILADTLRFGESVGAPRDIAVHGLLQQAQSLSPESGRQVLADVENSLVGAAAQPDARPEPALEARQQSQTLLLLAWNLEERMLDLRHIDAGLRSSWQRLGESLDPLGAADGAGPASAAGVDAEDESDADALALGRMLAGMNPPDAFAESLPWRRILEAFAVLAPGLDLVTADASIVAALREAGLPEIRGAFEAPAWRLAGHDRCPAGKPWLEVLVRLGGVQARQGAA